jgi:predicted acetyltransferase
MEKFHYESPSLNRKNEIINFLDEFVKYKSTINGSGGMDKIYARYTFEDALDRCLKKKMKNMLTVLTNVQAKHFY